MQEQLRVRLVVVGLLAAVLWVVPAWSAKVAVRFRQSTDCALIMRWELLAASVLAGQPEPLPWDAPVVATIDAVAASGTCGSEQRATVEAELPRGWTRFWLRAVAASGVALSESVDALLPRGDVALRAIAGGGDPTRDCLLIFLAPTPPSIRHPRRVRCTDGDPQCDADGTVDGGCTIPVGVCANSSFSSQFCVSPAVGSIAVHGASMRRGWLDESAAALQAAIDVEIRPPTSTMDACTTPVWIRLSLTGRGQRRTCRASRKRFVVTAFAPPDTGVRWRDRDELRLVCRSASTGCKAGRGLSRHGASPTSSARNTAAMRSLARPSP